MPRLEPALKSTIGVSDEADRRAARALVPVSRETEQDFATYVDLLRRWQSIKNLVGPSTLSEVWTRHIADSAQLIALAPPDARHWVDLGSGAGFPGLVVALMLKQCGDVQVDLVESNQRKCAFLREVIRATGAPARVIPGRIEAVISTLTAVDVVTSRALAPLDDLLAMNRDLLAGGALGLFLTGGTSLPPTELAAESDGFVVESLPSVTHSTGRIIRVRARLPSVVR